MSEFQKKFSLGRMLAADCVLCLVLLGIDQYTKLLAIQKLKGQAPFSLIPGVFEFSYVQNTGSAFSMFEGKRIFILVMCACLMAFMTYVLFRLPRNRRFIAMHLCLAAIISGGIGNMIDRFRFGYVVDFLSFVLIHFPVFNFADCCVVVAVIVMCFLFLFVYKEEEMEAFSILPSRKKKDE